MASESNTALAALVVGLVALIIASGQLLQQMFSTADGYRRCQRPVIGPWARKTRLVWHWKQFRFETRFTTPEIVLYERRAPCDAIDLNAQQLPAELYETISLAEYGSDMVTWTSFIKELAALQGNWQNVKYGSRIGVKYRERSWDLMPIDTTRPMASSRLSTIIVLALRLGMKWEDDLRAEGNGHSLVSTTMRGYGIVFQYNRSEFSTVQSLIPRRSTDMMSCGIIPGDLRLGTKELPLKGKNATEDSILLTSALTWLGVARSTISAIPISSLPVHDMIALLVPFLPLGTNTRIAYPIQTNMTASAFLMFPDHLLSYIPSSRHLDVVRQKFQFLQDEYPKDFLCVWHEAIVNDISATEEVKSRFIETLRDIHDWTTEYFEKFEIKFKDLVAAHVTLATNAIGKSWPDAAKSYSKGLPILLQSLNYRIDESKVLDAWWTLMLRGVAWRMSCFVSHQESVVSSRLYYDQTPVYII